MTNPISRGATPPATAPNPPHKKVLIVDDLAASAETLQMILEMEGHVVEVAREGRAAITLATGFAPDVVILDIGLPGMDGYEVARHLRTQPLLRHTRLIALTGYGDAESQRRTSAAGFDHHVVKPADIDALLALVAAN